ncbi:MAG: hypothetical protein ACK5NK_11655 [Niabella sp.]
MKEVTPLNEVFSPIRKALRVNLDPGFYGSFAEIGAGQDVANIFFEAGGASQTIAKTMSAYDMTFSDAIYGAETHGRYVSQSRLKKMLDHEYLLLEERLGEKRTDTCFFAFANTVATINYQRTTQGHGWLGCRFQTHPDKEPNELIIHVRLKETEKLHQHKTLGIIGVNLVFACRFLTDNPEAMMNSLMDNLSWHKLEVDMFSLSGPDFQHVDERLMSLKLVINGLTDATMFMPNGNIIQPTDYLYGKNVLIFRSRFKPITKLSVDIITNAIRDFLDEPDTTEESAAIVAELTINDLQSIDKEIDEQDFLDRVEILCNLGQTVMISNFPEHYVLSRYISQHFTKKRVSMVLGVPTLIKVLDESYYNNLPGGILEGLSRLFNNRTKMYVYPTLEKNGDITTVDNLKLAPNLQPLYNYLKINKKIVNVKKYDKALLHIEPDNVLHKLQSGDVTWEQDVPVYVANIIKEKKVFGYIGS